MKVNNEILTKRGSHFTWQAVTQKQWEEPNALQNAEGQRWRWVQASTGAGLPRVNRYNPPSSCFINWCEFAAGIECQDLPRCPLGMLNFVKETSSKRSTLTALISFGYPGTFQPFQSWCSVDRHCSPNVHTSRAEQTWYPEIMEKR